MNQKRLKGILIFMLMGVQAGCGQAAPDKNGILQEAAQNTAYDHYRVYLELPKEELGKYEAEGFFLGAAAPDGSMDGGSLSAFEARTEVSHQIYTKTMRIDEPYPLEFALECYALGKIPCIILYPEDGYDFFYQEELSDLAAEFGTLKLPVFLQLYPNPSQYGVSPEEYKEQFLTVQQAFLEAAPNVAVAFCVGWQEVLEESAYYPGDEAVDWVGISMYGEPEDTENLLAALDYFYYTYQKQKPLFIAQLGISHYSTSNYSYQTAEAGDALLSLYRKIQVYPRLRGVIYMNRNEILTAPRNAQRDDYTVTAEPELLLDYQECVRLFDDKEAGQENSAPRILSPFWGVLLDGEVYLSEKTLTYDLGIRTKEENQVLIDGMPYAPFLSVEGWEMQALPEKKEIILTRQENKKQ